MPIALRWSVLSLLTLLGLAGLVQLPLVPPLASRTGAGTERVLADLATQEAQLDTRERARQLLSRFLGAEITRYFWGASVPISMCSAWRPRRTCRPASAKNQVRSSCRWCPSSSQSVIWRGWRSTMRCPAGWPAAAQARPVASAGVVISCNVHPAGRSSNCQDH